jgi:hypothetical protein
MNRIINLLLVGGLFMKLYSLLIDLLRFFIIFVMYFLIQYGYF